MDKITSTAPGGSKNVLNSDVEIKGDLKEIKKGEIEIERDGAFTKIEMKLDGEKETARVPTSWLGVPVGNKEQEFEIVGRRVDVDDVEVLGACTIR